jgi:MMP 1-O-methyltransferase
VTLAQRVLVALARTPLGRRALNAVLLADPRPALLPLGSRLGGDSTWDRVQAWPGILRGFEDLAFLFSSNRANVGIASLMLDEAAYLYRLARDVGPGTAVEIGRYKGGSTFVLAAGMHPQGRLVSYDPHVKLRGGDPDAPLRSALQRYGLDERVELVVGDSRTAEAPAGPVHLVFVDGDHRYEAVKADHERWTSLLAPGGHVLFHDAVEGAFAVADPGVARLVSELDGDERLRREAGAGSLAHFVRTG